MSSTHLHSLIGLKCEIFDDDVYLIIDVKPESDTLIVLNNDGALRYVEVTSIFLTEKSQNKLVERLENPDNYMTEDQKKKNESRRRLDRILRRNPHAE